MFLFWPIKIALKIVGLIITALVIYLIYCGAEVVLASNTSSTPQPASPPLAAIVVLVPEQKTATPTPDLIGRLTEATSLYRAGISTKLLLVPTNTSLPIPLPSTAPLTANPALTAARSWLLVHGLPVGDIAVAGGATTYSSLVSATQQLGANSMVAVVTDAISSYWVSHAAASSGMHVTKVYPANGSKQSVFNELGALWRQATGVAIGRFIGYGRTSWVNS